MKNPIKWMLLTACLLLIPALVSAQTFRGNTQRGYRGFVSAGVLSTLSSGYDTQCAIDLDTSHGYQFNKVFFLGAGVGLHSFISNDSYDSYNAVPVFLHARCDFPISKVGPFIETKAGYWGGDAVGLFISEHVGCRFALSGKTGFSVSAGVMTAALIGGTGTCWSLKAAFDF